MGLNASSDKWCCHSDVIIRGLPWARKIVDDTLIWVAKESEQSQSTNWDKQYHVILASFNTNRTTVKHSEHNIYTDGSKTENGVGSGFVVYHKNTRLHVESISLPDTTTVFQAEIIAIYKAMLFMVRYSRSNKVSYIKILCNSQAAITALDSKDIRSRAVLKTIEAQSQN